MKWFGGLIMAAGWFVVILGAMSVGRFHLFGPGPQDIVSGFAMAWGTLAVGIVVILFGRWIRKGHD